MNVYLLGIAGTGMGSFAGLLRAAGHQVYGSAYLDKGRQFLHHRPRTAIVTGAEFDHAAIYRGTPPYESAFEKFYGLIPSDGYAAACSPFPNWKPLASVARCRVESYSSKV